MTEAERVAGEMGALGGRPADTAPAAVSVLAGRFDSDCGEWVFGVVSTPLAYPFTHWWPLPDLAADALTTLQSRLDEALAVLRNIANHSHSEGMDGVVLDIVQRMASDALARNGRESDG